MWKCNPLIEMKALKTGGYVLFMCVTVTDSLKKGSAMTHKAYGSGAAKKHKHKKKKTLIQLSSALGRRDPFQVHHFEEEKKHLRWRKRRKRW